MTHGNHAPNDQPGARDLDRLLAYIDGELSVTDADRLLNELDPAERIRVRALRADALLLRAMPAPDAPDELHEAIMAAAERAELFAGTPRGARLNFAEYAEHSHAADASAGVVARPWAVRWRTAGAVAAMLVMGLGVTWALWPRQPLPLQPGVLSAGPAISEIVGASYAPVPAPYALVLEFDDVDEAEAALRSAVRESPEARLTHCCPGHCTAVVEGPPHVMEDGGSGAEYMALADVPSHQMIIPAADLSRIVGTLMAGSNGSLDPHRGALNRIPVPSSGNVDLPIFIVPTGR